MSAAEPFLLSSRTLVPSLLHLTLWSRSPGRRRRGCSCIGRAGRRRGRRSEDLQGGEIGIRVNLQIYILHPARNVIGGIINQQPAWNTAAPNQLYADILF